MPQAFPIHPVTGVRAIGFSKRGPIWPVIGASPDHDGDPASGAPPAGEQGDGQPPADRGFPADTPIAEMTVEQQLAYFKHHDRRKAEQLKKFGGITPEEARAAADRVAELEREQLSAADKAIADARDQASAEATATTEARVRAEMAGQLLEATVAGSGLPEEQQKAVLAMTDAAKFLDESGTFDTAGLRAHLATFASTTQSGTSRQWGQSGNNQPPANTGAALGLAEAHKRFGKNS